jgi:DNA-binding transcriptional LysR family regulator
MMDYRLHVFQKVAELQSTTRAARVLHLSQPAVTKHIQLLEEELQVPLFVRTGRGMVLNESGIIFLRHVQQVAQAHENVAQQLQKHAGVYAGRLRLGSNKTILAYCLPEIMARFKARYPWAHCEIIDGNTDTIIGALLDQRIDLALIEGPCRRPEIQISTFFQDEIIWIASPQDPLAQIHNPKISEILSRPIIVREAGAGTRQFMEQELHRLRIPLKRLKIAQEIPGPGGVKRLVAAGLGIGYVFRISVEQELADGKLVKIHCPKLSLRRPFSLLCPQGPTPPGIAQAFIQVLMEKKARHAGPGDK